MRSNAVPVFLLAEARDVLRLKERIMYKSRVLICSMRIVLACTAIFMAASGPSWPLRGGRSIAAAVSCDRACLDGFANQYLSALLAHDPSRAPLAKTVTFTEN